jgi:uncharacterized protein (TIGR03084 family)
MPVDLASLIDDLADESDITLGLLAALSDDDWALQTPAIGWTITDQVSHLAYFDETTTQSIVDPEAFRAAAAALTAAGDDYPDRIAATYHSMPAAELLDWFRTARATLLATYRAADPAARLTWYGPDMGVASSVTARLMETWAHTQDIVDTVGVTREPTKRLRSVAHLGVAGLPYSYAVNGRELPTEPIRVELQAPDGSIWSWGPADAMNRVEGSALDFCLVVTQRRNLVDTDVVVTGPVATDWLWIAQTFAGPAGTGREPQAAVSVSTGREI